MRCCSQSRGRLSNLIRRLAVNSRGCLQAMKASTMSGARNAREMTRPSKKVEVLFAHLKRILRLDRLRLRGPSGTQFKFTFAAIAQNLRCLGKLIPRPPPRIGVKCIA